ncbi:hypothetical protein [Streptomyces sp. NPDC002205]|uniref:hypothetical protein n=1 Tax=Streptomyces sp. NPDC002205 TaxID=3154411 RepID=UPI00331BDBB8
MAGVLGELSAVLAAGRAEQSADVIPHPPPDLNVPVGLKTARRPPYGSSTP